VTSQKAVSPRSKSRLVSGSDCFSSEVAISMPALSDVVTFFF